MSSSNDMDVAQKYGINKSLLSKWKKDAKNIKDAVAQKQRRLLKKIRPSTRHKDLFKQLHQKFATARSKGRKVSYAWFYATANKVNKEMHGTDSPRLLKSVVTRFIKSYNIKLRPVQRKKTVNTLSHLPKLMTWHTTLREGLIKTGSHLAYYDTKWGRFTPERRFNVDQMPMPFVIDSKTTNEINLSKAEKHDHRVWVANPGSGLDKNQCTLRVCISPESKARIAIIFSIQNQSVPP